MSIMLFLLTALLVSIASAQDMRYTNDPAMYRVGYDIPAGVDHGTWDFDEWPGVDHDVVYKTDFMYGDPNEKIKIDYNLSVFDADDHEGYLKSPEELLTRFSSMDDELARAKSIVGIFAHPDDEILLAGGLFAWAAKKGLRTRIYILSNGADGTMGFSDKPDPELNGYNCSGIMPNGSTRVATDIMGLEKARIMRSYAEVLGVRIEILPVRFRMNRRNVVQIGEYTGMDFKRSFAKGSVMREALEESVMNMLEYEQPDIVVTHGTNGEYGNYFHKSVNAIVLDAVNQLRNHIRITLFTGFPEYNYDDRITHFLDLHSHASSWSRKWDAFRSIEFLYKEGNDYDKPWNPNNDLMNGVFVKDYGYTPVEGKPPRYEFFQRVTLGD